MNSIDPILKLEGVYKYFGEIKVLKGANFEVFPGEVVLITGENGVGKSTLFKIIAGITPANGGRIYFDGVDITHKNIEAITNLGIDLLMQGGVVFPNLYVCEHFELAMRGVGKKYSKKDAQKVIELIPDIQKIIKKRAGLLSGGERQLLAISLLILRDAKLWLLDEPLSGLSSKLSKMVTKTISSHCVESKISVILIEQKTNEIRKIASKIFTLNQGQIF